MLSASATTMTASGATKTRVTNNVITAAAKPLRPPSSRSQRR